MRRSHVAPIVALALAVIPAGALAATHTYKTGTYKGKTSVGAKLSLTLKKTRCKPASGQGASAPGLCVALTTSPEIECRGNLNSSGTFQSFATPVRLSASGKAIEHATISAQTVPGAAPSPGTQVFSVSFTKKGTATGYFEENIAFVIQGASLPCTSGKVAFTAKL